MRILDFVDGFESQTEPETEGISATDIVVTPSGNLSSTTGTAALNELQGDIDTINAKIGAANGIASLDSGGKIPAAQIPLVALVDVNVVADITARDALTVQEGDVAVVTNAGGGISKTYIYNGSSWTELVSDGSLAAHLADSADAHAGSAITNTPSGNLAATTVQGAVNELQGDIDTINANDWVTNTRLANMAQSTIKGKAAGSGTGDPTDLTATEATAILNDVVGDSGSGGTKGLVPAPGAGDAANGKYLKSDGTWQVPSGAAAPDQPYELSNYSLSISVASNALTVALKIKGGSDPSAGSPVRIGMRSSTATSGDYNTRTVTGAISVTIRSGDTLGSANGIAQRYHVWAIDNAGTIELAVCGSRFFRDSQIASTTAITGGALTGGTTLYSTTARSNVSIAYLGSFVCSEATAGTWATAPSEVTTSSEVINEDTYGQGGISNAPNDNSYVGAGMATNYVQLSPGKWELNGHCVFGNSGSSPSYTNCALVWSTAVGQDNSTTPAFSGPSILAGSSRPYDTGSGELESVSYVYAGAAPTIMSVTSNTKIWLVPYVKGNATGNARLTVSVVARKIGAQ